MSFSIRKLVAGSVAAAVVGISAVSGSVSFASSASSITVSPSATTVAPSGTIDVMVGYEPGSDGVAAFTVDLKYDSDKLEVYTPTQEELEDKYNVATKFSYVAYNYNYSDDAVRISGYSTGNVKSKSNLALVTFKVKESAKNSVGFWISKDTVTTIDQSGGLEEASCTVPTKSSVVKVTVKSAETVVPATTASGSENTTTAAPQVNSPPQNTSDDEDNVVTSLTPVSSEVLTTPDSADGVVSDTQDGTVTTAPTAEEGETPTETSDSSDSPDSTAEDNDETSDEPIFSYTYEGEGDFEETDDANFSFNLGDYVDDFDAAYDVDINVSATGGVNGAIGYNNTDGVWETVEYRFTQAGNAVWSVEGLIMNENDDLIVIPIYYMANGATFTVDSIEVTAVETTDNEGELGTEDNNQPADSVTGETDNAVGGEAEEQAESVETESDETPKMESAEATDEDKSPDTGSLSVILIVALPFVMVAATAVTVIRLRKKIK